MDREVPLVYKIATEEHEFEQIHALNYRTFVDEIPQHAPNGERRLVDRRHDRNTYVICLAGRELAGMVALCGARPFSLDEKLTDLDRYLPAGPRPCEIRLLAVAPRFRKSAVFAGLMLRLSELARARGYGVGLISGTTRQLRLYTHMGFVPFGPLVGSAAAPYQPMMLTLDRFDTRLGGRLDGLPGGSRQAVSFLPGPVQIGVQARRAFGQPPLSHRSPDFGALLARVKARLRAMTGAAHAALLLGSGTLANDAVAAQLSTRRGRGLVLANGEFGERLVDHAARWRLDFDACRRPWGEPFDAGGLRRLLGARPAWIWLAHCETSTGMLNDLAGIERLCAGSGTAVCVDAISSLGTVPVDLRGVAFATAVSGKGLAAHSGLAIVLHRDPAEAGARLPRYLDLALYGEEDSVPFTQSSSLLASLDAALADAGPQRHERIRRDGALLRRRLEESGLRCVVDEPHASPAVLTVALPASVLSVDLGRRLARFGYRVACDSAYLVERNWLQVALMGEYSVEHLADLAALLHEAAQPRDLAA